MDPTPYLTVRPAPFGVLLRAAEHPDRARFRVRSGTGWTKVTWGRFAQELRAVARWLADAGVSPGDTVAVFAPNSVEWAAAALGIQAAGAVLVPIYPASTAEQAAYVLDHADVRVVFAGAAERARIAAVNERLPRLRDVVALGGGDEASTATPRATEVARGSSASGGSGYAVAGWRDILDAVARDRANPAVVDDRLAAITLDQRALMLYTSGTSGPPKGVPLTHGNVGISGVDWMKNNAPLIEEGDRDLLWLPMSHIFGFGELCLGNTCGWESWMVSPAEVLEVFPEVAPHAFLSVPAYWEKLARAIGERADSPGGLAAAYRAVTGGNLRFGLSGGAGLKIGIKELLRDAGLVVIEGYGLTETSPTLTINRPGDYRFDSVGKPLPHVEIKLADDGEILARGPNVFAGYHKDAAATAAAFTGDGWFKTGDVGRWTDDGFLQIVDRKKDILVTAGGKNVPPANIEARFAGDPVIERVVVYGEGKPYLVAAVWTVPGVPAADRAALVQARIDAVNAELARFETIKKHWLADAPLSVEDGTLTTSLKLRRKVVYERWRDRFEALYT
jgi:long-chain acyl-CoA synthetase